MAGIDDGMNRYAERGYGEIGQMLGVSQQCAQILGSRGIRKLWLARNSLKVRRLLETAQELDRLRSQRVGNCPWNDVDAEAE